MSTASGGTHAACPEYPYCLPRVPILPTRGTQVSMLPPLLKGIWVPGSVWVPVNGIFQWEGGIWVQEAFFTPPFFVDFFVFEGFMGTGETSGYLPMRIVNVNWWIFVQMRVGIWVRERNIGT